MFDQLRQHRAMFELALFALAIVVAWWLVPACGNWFATRSAQLAAEAALSRADMLAHARMSALLFSIGVIVLAIGRALGLRHAEDPIAVPLLLPGAIFACLLGLALHAATVDTTLRLVGAARAVHVVAPSARDFAEGFVLGAIVAAIVLAFPWDPATVLARFRGVLLLLVVGSFVALAFFGSGPGESHTRVNLGPFQPIEVVKPAFVAVLAAYFGPRAAKLRWQRRRKWHLRWPRPKLLLPAVVFLAAIFAGLFLVKDLGPTLILAFVFLGMSYAVTRASGWIAVALALLFAFVLVIALWPGLSGSGHVITRMRMWIHPWTNGLTHGHQLGEALWAVSAGGLSGQGFAHANVPLVPAGKTDLILATYIEQSGCLGLFFYLGLLAIIVLSGFYVAIRNRTTERALLACGLSLLLLGQWAVIHGGTLGLLPLTGIVVPFLSSGRSSMVAFLFTVALIARLGDDGRARVQSEELDELAAGMRPLLLLALGLLCIGGMSGVLRGVIQGGNAAMGIVTRLRDGTVVHRQNPRLLAIVQSIRRGAIEDRRGSPLASTPAAGAQRTYPLGSALGTLLGTHPSRVLLPSWALERRWDERLRGYPERTGGPRYDAYSSSTGPLPWPDLRSFVPLLRVSQEERAPRIRDIDSAIAKRSVKLTLDARLQRETSRILQAWLKTSKGTAAASVVIDVDTGETLARAQVPDLDPGDGAWQNLLLEGDDTARKRFTGAYGPWPDRTGIQGIFQSGSVGKLVTALVAARRGWNIQGNGCEVAVSATYSCAREDDQGPMFVLPGWPKPIHDLQGDRLHGTIDVVQALAVSCNVYFAQLGLAVGSGGYRKLVGDGLEIGFQGNPSALFDPGADGSRSLALTGFGQGSMAMSVQQTARLAAAIGAGGTYRKCPPNLELGAKCAEIAIVDDARSLLPVLAGMRRVMTSGTGRSLRSPAGVRVYGKTGTADASGFRGEEPFGIAPAAPAPPHSWFVALAEPETAPACEPAAPGRLAVAVVVNRGGRGSAAAGPAAMEILTAARSLGYLGGVK